MISAATSQKREHQQQKNQRISAVRSPDGVFTISASAIILFRWFSANLQFNFRFAIIFKQSTHQRHKKKITSATATETATPESKCRSNPLMEYLRWAFLLSFCSVHSPLTFSFIFVWHLFSKINAEKSQKICHQQQKQQHHRVSAFWTL